jgi:2-polyprenyl-3-methyl-5-hydroxy-6-metoxy-1,4-benzoquinol methylase
MSSSGEASTRIGNFRTFSITRGLNPETTSTDANILRLVGRDKRVLELGCGSGHMSTVLHEQGCTVVGIEIDPRAAQSAASICERVIIGDLDYLDFYQQLGNDRFDIVLAADVLEHLKDPLSVLQTVKQFLTPHGHVVISVPNVAHISIRLALLAGRFPYGKTGLLDETHLRFLTRESLEKLMADAKLAIGHLERIHIVPPDPASFEVPYDPAILPPPLLEEILRDPDALTYQFVVSAYPLPLDGDVEIAYQQVLEKMRTLIRERLPDGGVVLVLSRGDDELLQIAPCRGYHFPQGEDGKYAGYYPVDGISAVEHLTNVHAKGAQFLLIPETSLWWLDEYRELAVYLNGSCTRIIDEPGICVLFEWNRVCSRGL